MKIILRHNLRNTTSETYKFKVGTFNSGHPEEILQLLTKFDKAVVRTGTSSNVGNITFMKTLLWCEVLREYDWIIVTFGGTTVTHLQDIRKLLIKYLFPINARVKQKRAMRRMMRKPRGVKLQQFAARLQALINLLPKIPESEKSRNIPQEDIN